MKREKFRNDHINGLMSWNLDLLKWWIDFCQLIEVTVVIYILSIDNRELPIVSGGLKVFFNQYVF